jgi:hypothetical protein
LETEAGSITEEVSEGVVEASMALAVEALMGAVEVLMAQAAEVSMALAAEVLTGAAEALMAPAVEASMVVGVSFTDQFHSFKCKYYILLLVSYIWCRIALCRSV